MKKKILLLHGALGSKMQFTSLKNLLSDTFDVYDLNFEGHGGSATNKNFSIALFTQNVIDFLERESINNINIFGYSMGGYVALSTAIKIPNKIDRIMTLGTKFNWDQESTSREVRMLNPDKMSEKVPQFVDKLKAEHHPENWRKIVEKTAGMMIGLSEGEALNDDDIQHIQQQVYICVGSLDRMVSFEESIRVANLLPNGKVESIEGFEHVIDKISASDLLPFIKQAFID